MSNARSGSRSVMLDRSKLLGFDQLPPQGDGSLPSTSRLTKIGEKRARGTPSTPEPAVQSGPAEQSAD